MWHGRHLVVPGGNFKSRYLTSRAPPAGPRQPLWTKAGSPAQLSSRTSGRRRGGTAVQTTPPGRRSSFFCSLVHSFIHSGASAHCALGVRDRGAQNGTCWLHGVHRVAGGREMTSWQCDMISCCVNCPEGLLRASPKPCPGRGVELASASRPGTDSDPGRKPRSPAPRSTRPPHPHDKAHAPFITRPRGHPLREAFPDTPQAESALSPPLPCCVDSSKRPDRGMTLNPGLGARETLCPALTMPLPNFGTWGAALDRSQPRTPGQ